MASFGHHAPATAAAYAAPMQMQPPTAPAGTFAPGTKIQVGSHRVVIQKYLSEGGFAHVYLVKLPKPVDGTDLAVLKRVAVPDKEALKGMRTEVETMKKLKGHRPIVTYMDSHASELRGGGYEVFLLMEYCNGGGLIDFMNTRLQHRLTEPEILKIFADVAEGVACMHYLRPPLLHRDLKVENVLITAHGSNKRFKLCDFGSAATPRPAPTTVVECRLMDEDVQKHTTLQYRSPEMIDVYRKQPIDEKSDIWALGVLLYKLCYYTTPFEDQGQLAILNASYKFPSYPVFSDRLKRLIASMLKESQQKRPNIYQVLREACIMQNREVPIHDIYSERSHSEPRKTSDRQPATEKKLPSTPVVGAVFSPPVPQQQVVPDIVPMRRGRLPATSAAAPAVATSNQQQKPSVSPMRVINGDPFAALDAKQGDQGLKDELSSRFPTLDQFSLLHDQGSKFDFDNQPSKDIGQRVAEKLADEAFAVPQVSPTKPVQTARPKTVAPVAARPTSVVVSAAAVPLTKVASAPVRPTEMSRAQAIISNNPELQAISSQSSSSRYVSTGTMTSTPPPERPINAVPIYRFPPADQHRSSSLPRQNDVSPSSASLRSGLDESRSANVTRAPSLHQQSLHARHPSSSRPSLEGGRPNLDALEPSSQARQQSLRPRPASTHLDASSDYLKEREWSTRPAALASQPSPKLSGRTPSPRAEIEAEETNIESSVDFLKSMEESDSKSSKRHSHGKRSSMNAISGKKNIFAGKFGDAFKKFENSNPSNPARPRTPSPLRELERRELTPIAGSEAADGRSDDGQVLEETDDMTPEMRREIERRRLSMEEKRVAAAQAEYRQRLAERGPGSAAGGTATLPKSIGGVSRAVSIQNRVQNLLSDDPNGTSTVKRQAEGYGKYSDAATAASRVDKQLPDIPRKPVGTMKGKPVPPSISSDTIARQAMTVSATATIASRGSSAAPRPVAPRKPVHLNQVASGGRAGSPPKPALPPQLARPSTERIAAMDLPGQPVLEMSAQDRDDYIRDFSKRFPSLNAIEMVERDLAAEARSSK